MIEEHNSVHDAETATAPAATRDPLIELQPAQRADGAALVPAAPEAVCGAVRDYLASSEGLAAIQAIVADYLLTHPPTIGVEQMEQLTDTAQKLAAETVANAQREAEVFCQELVDNAKADILKTLTPMLVAATAPPSPVPAVTAAPAAKPLTIGDPVQVFTDRERKTFLLGTIAAIHEDGHAYDVKLESGDVAKVPAEGLALDTRR